MTIDGLVTPAFIHNGTFFLVGLPVYADGLIDCWEMVDLPLFREKLKSGWVTPTAAEGAPVSVHGLGAWVISAGSWELDAAGLYARVEALLAKLNPRLENLHDCHGRTVEKRGNLNVAILGMPKKQPVRVEDPSSAFPKRVQGEQVSLLVKSGDDYEIANARVYSDGVVELTQISSPERLDVSGLHAAASAGRIVGSAPRGARMHVRGRLNSWVGG